MCCLPFQRQHYLDKQPLTGNTVIWGKYAFLSLLLELESTSNVGWKEELCGVQMSTYLIPTFAYYTDRQRCIQMGHTPNSHSRRSISSSIHRRYGRKKCESLLSVSFRVRFHQNCESPILLQSSVLSDVDHY